MKKYLFLILLFLPLTSHAALTDSLVSYWKLDESSGNPADSVGTNTLTNNNTTTFTAALINNGASMNGTNKYFSITDASQTGLDGMTDLSISMWFKPSGTVGAEQELVAKYINAGQKSYRLYADSGVVNFQTSTDGTTGSQASITQTLSDATWYHIVVTKSGTTAVFYINNATPSVTGSLSTSIKNGTDNFYIGTRVVSGDFANGLIDEIGIWNRTLTADEVTSLYNGGAGFAYPFVATAAADDTYFDLLDE